MMDTQLDSGANSAPQKGSGLALAIISVTVLFFIWAVITNLLDPLLKTMKTVFTLSKFEAQLTTSAFFIAYGVMSIPSAWVLSKLGYLKAVIVGLMGIVIGCLVALVSTQMTLYSVFLIALFTMASGITLLQVSANPLIASMGDPRFSAFRLNLSQAFNSLGAVAGIYFGSTFLLTSEVFKDGVVMTPALQTEALSVVGDIYLKIAIALVFFILLIAMVGKVISDNAPKVTKATNPFMALSSKWANLGALAIFFYVGAEVAIGSTLILFLEQKNVLNIDALTAGKLTALYMLFAMIGRFVGAGLLRFISGPAMLSLVAIGAMLLCAVVMASQGAVGVGTGTLIHVPVVNVAFEWQSTSLIGFAALLIGLFNSIMFPTIFTTTLERSSAPASATSGLLCLAIVGGAFVPLAFSALADKMGSLSLAYAVPLLCYAYIFWFARASRGAEVHAIEEGVSGGH
jgi:MFS transporter, FHS family, L-fucose permease